LIGRWNHTAEEYEDGASCDNDANGDGKAASDDVMKMADLYKSIKEMKCSGIPSIWDRDRY
jgi:hypothetical protein